MEVVVAYESRTGTTRSVALGIGDALFDRGVACRTYPVGGIDPGAVTASDVLIVGTWTDGLFVVGQRPGGRRRIEAMVERLGDLSGKRCLVYCTYAVAPGKTLERLKALVEAAGGDVVGGLAVRRDRLDEGVDQLAGVVGDLSTV